MQGTKCKEFKTYGRISLDELMPKDHFYRHLEAKLDLSFVRDLVANCYVPRGRPSIDPVVYFKLQLIMFFEDIRSERKLLETVEVNIAHRWYLGYDLAEKLPHHSSLTKIRQRYGVTVFHRFFERITELCQEAGLVWGEELYIDATKVSANAAIDSMVPRWYWEALHPEDQTDETPVRQDLPASERLIQQYNGRRLTDRRRKTYQRKADQQLNPYDPDTTPMKRFPGDRARLGYHTHYVVDGGKSRIILACLVTPASIMENTPALDLIRWVRFRWHLHPQIVVGDTTYGTVPNFVGLAQDGIRAYFPVPDHSQRNAFYDRERFTYDTEHDLFLCPQNQELPLHKVSRSENEWVYRAPARVCNACVVKSRCTNSKSGQYIRRSFFQDFLDQATSYRDTPAYQKTMRKRQVWIEPLFGEAKQWHGLRHFRLHRLPQVNIQNLVIAAGQNLKRLLQHLGWGRRWFPTGNSAVLPLPSHFIFVLLLFQVIQVNGGLHKLNFSFFNRLDNS